MPNSTKIVGVGKPPPGVQANFVNPETQTTGIIALHTTCLVITTLCLAIRLYTRKFITRAISLDDYCCFFAWCLNVAFSGLNLQADAQGLSRHFWDLPRSQFTPAFEPFVIGVCVYYVLAASIKLTCLLFYRNIFSPSHKTLIFVNAGIVFVLLVYTGMFFAQLFNCSPVQLAWDMTLHGHCTPKKIMTYLSGAVNAATDIYVLMVPVPAVWALPVDTGRKIRVVSVFSLGFCACIMSIVRLGMLNNLYTNKFNDISWIVSEVGIWAIIEVNVGLMCACMLVFPAFLKHYWPKRINKYFARVIPYRFTKKETSFVTVSGLSSGKRSYPGQEWSSRNFSDGVNLSAPEPEFSTTATNTTELHDLGPNKKTKDPEEQRNYEAYLSCDDTDTGVDEGGPSRR
ncbi:hypothetical protein BGZ60DRAFT_192892 [Tricladium varicosporioides]|nr:hypothetical protein BGZ60DRAFT_192892 [Hymenoscyphus varicosporioides]